MCIDSYIVIEVHGGPEYAAICVDENGENVVFDSREDAEEYAKDWQDAIVVEL